MSLLQTVKENRLRYRKAAMKTKSNRDVLLSSLYTTILGEFERTDRSIDDQSAIKVLKSIRDKLKETYNMQDDPVKLVELEIEVSEIDNLMPKFIGVDDMQRIKGASDSIKNYMQAVKQEAASKGMGADMKLASKIWNQ